MAPSLFSLLLRRRALRKPPSFPPAAAFRRPSATVSRPFSTAAPLPNSTDQSKPPNLSARLSFVFDQIDAIDRDRDRDRSAKDAALQRIRAWRQTNPPPPPQPPPPPSPEDVATKDVNLFKKEVEVVHPWPEWIALMERLGQQNYFDRRRVDEDQVAENVPLDLSGISEETGFDYSRDWITVRTACMNFGRDRFDILRSLSRNDLQILVGHGCPSMDPKVVFSAKLLRKYVHLDEGDVCSSCSLRNSCSRGYILTRKEDEARTLDVMHILLTFGFDHVNGTVENKPLMKNKSIKTVVRKLLNEVVKLSAVPIDPNLPPPVIKKPPPKVKQPPPPPKKRVGRNDVEMKKGDWLCTKCDFMNFAKNTVCLQCDAKRPKRQLLPGEWECPQCNFLNYRRNMACFHCDHKRPPDEFTENQMQSTQSNPRNRLDRVARLKDVSNAWNFDFDDNESDGADVAAFEFAHPPKSVEDSSSGSMPHKRLDKGFEDDIGDMHKMPKTRGRERYFSESDDNKSTLHSRRTGFDDFDDEEDDVDSYELEMANHNQGHELHRKNFSELEKTSDSEDFDNSDHYSNSSRVAKGSLSCSEDDDLVDHPDLKASHVADSWRKTGNRGASYPHRRIRLGLDADSDINSDSGEDSDAGFESNQGNSHRQSFDRKGVRREINCDPDDDLFIGSESDDDDRRCSSGNKMRGSGSARSREFRSDNRTSNKRNSFDEFSPRGPRKYDRGSPGDGHGDWKSNDRFQRFDRRDDRDGSGPRQRGRDNQFNDRSRGSLGKERGSRFGGYGGGRREDSHGDWRSNDRFQHFDRLDDRDGSGPRQRGRDNQFNDRSRGSLGKERGSRSGGYGGGRREDGFRQRKGSGSRQQGKVNRFTDRSRSFDDYGDNDDSRPHRRIIER